MNDEEWKRLFKIAKEAILTYLDKGERIKVKANMPRKASFVTLEKNGELRGCIGSITPSLPLEEDVAKNAVNAAFFDPRFPPLSNEELPYITIEISILSPLEMFEGDGKKWINFIAQKKPGVFISTPYSSSTFLPQVWKHFSDPQEFMEALSLKASMPKDGWKRARKFYYFVESKKIGFIDI